MKWLFSLTPRMRRFLPKDKTKQELDEHYEKIKDDEDDTFVKMIAAYKVFIPVILIFMLVVFGILALMFLL